MSNLKTSSSSDQSSLHPLEQNPGSHPLLISDSDFDISRVSTLVEPILNVSSRCEVSIYYIQAVAAGRSAFLTTNLPDAHTTHVTEPATTWLVGRSRTCAIAIPNPSISRCHAVIGHCPTGGFYIMDLGSRNGTFVNQHRLLPQEQVFLQDGDVLEFSHTRVECFLSGWQEGTLVVQDTDVQKLG
jgi:hypothetical protein